MSWLHELCGAWVVLVHVAAGLFALAIAHIYTTVWRTPVLSYTITQVETDILDYFGANIAVSIGIVVGHVLLIARILLGNRMDRRMCGRGATVAAAVAVVPSTDAPRKRKSTYDRLSSWSARRTGVDKKQPMLKRWRTRYTPEITRLRMLGEVALQIYQANKTSQLVASVAINRLMALVIVFNCWLSPAVHYAMDGRPSITIRLVRLVLDACLDVVYSIAIPASIFMPYYHAYTGGPEMFEPTLYYMDTWYTNALSEMRQVFVISWFDWMAKNIGSLALLYRLYVVQGALTTARKILPQTAARAQAQPRYTGFVCKVLDMTLFVAGITVLALHIHASGVTVNQVHDDHRGCLLEMHPWGVTGYSCACLEISCSQYGFLGDHDRMQAILERVNPESVQVLIISNCPELQVPSAVQSVENAMMIKIYNSTIVSWDNDAALRQDLHPSLQVLYLARVNMSSFPTGLLEPDFPLNLWDIELCITNLTTLPELISQAWQRVTYVLMEGNSEMTEIPVALLQLPSLDSLLVGVNGIQSVPDSALENVSLIQIFLDHNPLQELPVSVGSFDKLLFVSVRGTYIRNLPEAWLSTAGDAHVPEHAVIVVGTGTPFCEDLEIQGATSTTVDGIKLFHVNWFLVDCVTPLPSQKSMYPIADEDEWRRQNQ